MLNKTEILYDLVFKSVKRIISKQNSYTLNMHTITRDGEVALINAINNNFPNINCIRCWFHLNQDLIRVTRTIGLFNRKNIKINSIITLR